MRSCFDFFLFRVLALNCAASTWSFVHVLDSFIITMRAGNGASSVFTGGVSVYVNSSLNSKGDMLNAAAFSGKEHRRMVTP